MIPEIKIDSVEITDPRSPSQMHLISTLWKWEIDFRLIYLNLM